MYLSKKLTRAMELECNWTVILLVIQGRTVLLHVRETKKKIKLLCRYAMQSLKQQKGGSETFSSDMKRGSQDQDQDQDQEEP